jgi:signal peptidase I
VPVEPIGWTAMVPEPNAALLPPQSSAPADAAQPARVLPPPELERWCLPPPEDVRSRAFRVRERLERGTRRRLCSALFTGMQLGVLLLVVYGLVFNFSVVRGSSMTPGIHDGDRIVIDHLSYVLGDVQRGDIVVLEYPLDPTVDYIKRVIGLPGDEIRIDGDRVCVNGRPIEEPYVDTQDSRTHLALTVQPGTYFVLGDNRPHSSDSREFGLVPRENLVGKVDLRVWPPRRVGLLY